MPGGGFTEVRRSEPARRRPKCRSQSGGGPNIPGSQLPPISPRVKPETPGASPSTRSHRLRRPPCCCPIQCSWSRDADGLRGPLRLGTDRGGGGGSHRFRAGGVRQLSSVETEPAWPARASGAPGHDPRPARATASVEVRDADDRRGSSARCGAGMELKTMLVSAKGRYGHDDSAMMGEVGSHGNPDDVPGPAPRYPTCLRGGHMVKKIPASLALQNRSPVPRLFARPFFEGGRMAGNRRARIWRDTDPARTGMRCLRLSSAGIGDLRPASTHAPSMPMYFVWSRRHRRPARAPATSSTDTCWRCWGKADLSDWVDHWTDLPAWKFRYGDAG